MRWTLLMLAGCGAMDAEPSSADHKEEAPAAQMAPGWGPGDEGRGAMGGSAPASPAPEMAKSAGRMMDGADRAEPTLEAEGKPEESSSARTRAWFPETFLWQPRLITDDKGQAQVSVRVPDSLTTWRVLGLAASREGTQAGAELSVLSTLSVYVDLILPEKLRLGDEWAVPIQVVNTSSSPYTGRLNIEGVGLSASAAGTVTVGARGSRVERAMVKATRPGPASLAASLGDTDAVQRVTLVEPTGRPIIESRSGLVGSGQSLELSTAAGAEYAELRLSVVPGPLGLLKAELGRGVGSGVGGLAYAVALGADGASLLQGLGAPPDAARLEQLRAIRLSAQQGLIRETRASSLLGSAMALDALQRVDDDPVAQRLEDRLHDQLLSQQLPDGTWPLEAGSTLQRLLVTTAYLSDTLDDKGAKVRASAVAERYGAQLTDPKTADAYTAAWVLKAGLASGDLKTQLQDLVRSAITPGPDGILRISVPDGVTRPDGVRPSVVELRALIAQVIDDPLKRDLIAAVVAGYHPRLGFGDGWTGMLALDALAQMDTEGAGEELDVVLKVDGVELRRIQLRGAALTELATVSAPAPLSGTHTYEVVAEGAWPGLSWQLELKSWVPWTGGVGPAGLEVRSSARILTAGKTTSVMVKASGPDGEALVLRHRPPAGFHVIPNSVSGGTVLRSDDEEVAIRVEAGHGGTATLIYQATPVLAGKLYSGASEVALARDEGIYAAQPPLLWTIE